MKKKLVIFCLMLCSIFGFVACGDEDPYASVTISKVGGNEPIHLMLEEVRDGVYESTSVSFEVQVSAETDVDLGVSVGAGRGFITTTSEYIGDGKTKITANAISPSNKGPFTLEVSAISGGEKCQIPFIIDVKLNDFDFKQNSLISAIRKGDSIDLSEVKSFIDFKPQETTQQNLKFDVVIPDGSTGDGVQYSVAQEELEFGKFAKFVNGTTLQTYSTYLDAESKEQPVTYPKKTLSSGSFDEDAQATYDEVVRISATYSDDDETTSDIVKYFDVVVLNDCTDIKLLSSLEEQNEKDVLASVSDKYEYNVKLVDQAAKGRLSADPNIPLSYYFGRALKLEYKAGNPSDFEVVSMVDGEEVKAVLPKHGKCVSILPSGELNAFSVESLFAGTYTHTFLLRHKEYPQAISHEIIVNFEVVSLPNTLYINNQELSLNPFLICDNYPGNGAEFNVQLGDALEIQAGTYRNWNYYLATDSDQLASKLTLNVKGMQETANFARLGADSLEKGEDPVVFGYGTVFYLKHEFSELSEVADNTIYIAIEFSLDTLSDEISTQYIYYPIKLKFEKTLATFFGENYEKTLFIDTADLSSAKTKLFALESELTPQKVVQSIEYDKENLKIDYEWSEEEGYVYYVEPLKTMKKDFKVTFTAKHNKLQESITIKCYMTSFYSLHSDAPLALEMLSTSNSYLYYVTNTTLPVEGEGATGASALEDGDGAETFDPKAKCEFGGINYESVAKLFMHPNSSVSLGIYDFLKGERIDISKNVKISIGNNRYVALQDGILTTQGETGETQITISYEFYRLDNKTIKLENRKAVLYVYILQDFKDLEVDVNLVNDTIYLQDYLGYYDIVNPNKNKMHEKHISTNFNKLTHAGVNKDWVGMGIGFSANDEAISLTYSYEMMSARPIYDSNGQQLKIKAQKTTDEYALEYGDLFRVDKNETTGECVVTCVMSEDLKNFINNHITIGQETILREIISSNNIVFQVDIKVRQFNYETVASSVTFRASVPEKTNGVKLDVGKQGIYEEIVGGSDSIRTRRIGYTINNFNATNKKLTIIQDFETTMFTTQIVQTNNGNTGYIEITPEPGASASEYYIVITTEDNIKGLSQSGEGFDFYNGSNMFVQTVRVKYSNGSDSHPFEISTVDDFDRMVNNVNEGHYNYYVLVNDIDLSSKNNFTPINLTNTAGRVFSLSGRFVSGTGKDQATYYSSILNLRIRKNLTSSDSSAVENIGLFGKIATGVEVKLEYLTIKNAEIVINNSLNSGFTGTVNVGIFAGLTDGGAVSQSSMSGVRVVDNTSYCKINSCVATGTIEVIGGNTAGTINIGGFVGNATKTAILGLPDNRVIGVSSTYDNANVVIKLANCGSSYVAGGIVGRINSCQLSDLQVVSLITAKKVGVFGGCVGLSSDAPSNISLVTASPKILVETDSNNTLKVGGILGESTASTDITHAIVYFVNIGNDYLGIEKINFRLDAPNSQAIVGGIVGSAYGNINYSYVRSFYNSTIGDNYLGNIYANVDKASEIGGIVGNYSHGIIQSSYFDGDIAVVKNDGDYAKVGLMLGGYKNVEILDSYAVGLIYRSEDGNTFVEVKDVVNGASIIGSIEFTDKEFVLPIVNNEENEEDDQVSAVNSEETPKLKISNSYAVLNNNVGFIVKTESSKIVLAGIYSEGNLLGDEIKNSLTKITDGSVSYDSENHKWFYNTSNKINTVGLNETTYQILPIIIDDKGKLMYDLVATGIDVGIDDETFKYDIHYDDENGRHHQILMLLQENPVYNIVISEESDDDDDKTYTLVVSYRGETIDTTNFKLKSNDRIELSILEDGDKGVFKLQGNTIVPLKAGKATLVISSYLDRDIKAEILIKVMHGISSNYHLENSSHEEVTEIANKTMYVTERNTFYIVDDNSTANDVKYLFHLVSCGVTIDNTYTNTGNIIVNGVTVNDGGVILLNNKQLDIIPKCKIGTMVNFKLVPILNLGDVTYNGTYEGISYPNSYIMKDESMIKSFTFDITGRTIELVNDLDSSVVSVSSSTQAVLSIVTNNITTTVTEGTNPTTTYSLGTTNLNELSFIFTNKKFILPQNIVGADGSDNTVSGNVVTLGTKGEFNYELFTFKFKPYTYEALSDGMFKVSIEYEVVFNETFYIDNAHMYDLSNINCKMTVMSETNTGLYSLVNWSIAPNELSRIYMDYYPRTQESNREYTILTETNTSSSMVYNENGIMKLTLDEKLNNSSYVEVLIPIEFKNDIILKQVSGVVDADTGILSKYYDIQNLGDARDHGGKYFGIRLARQTSSNDNIINYGNTYYIRLCMIGRLPKTSQIPVIVHSYEVKNNIATKTYENQKILSVQELPELSVALKGETDVERNVMGRGVKKQLDIDIENITNNIYYSISTNSGKDIDKIYVARYNGNKLEKANGVLDISYINSYFVCVDVECTVGEATIEFYASEVVLGEVEIATEELTFKIVEFEIDYITIDNEASYKNNDYSKAYITINQAEGFNIALTIKYKPIEIGTTEEVEKYKRALEDESIGTMSNKNIFEYQLARTEISNSTSSIISLNSDVSEYWLYCYDAEHQLYEEMDTFNTTYNNVKLITSSEEKDGYTYSYASLVGKIVSENNQFRLQFKYFYDYSEIEVDGKKVYTGMLKLGDTGEKVYENVIDIIITVEDNSTEDHPTPITTQEELVKYCNSKEGEGNYILLNDINLIDWEPMEINCRMLDGNGYVLKVSSFNMDKFRNQEKANAGIFSTISEHTLLKNITIDISELLVTETKFLNDEAILENSKAETYVHNQSNIDLSYIKNVNFGVLAGENNGTITNVKVVNKYNASANNSESEYLHVLVKQRDDLGTDYNHNIAGLVAVNNGYITNSFAGISNGGVIKIAPSYSNSDEDEIIIQSINVYPFAIVSGNVIGGLVSQNTKIISNSFVKGVGIYNLYPLGNKSATGGFVANNSSSGLITSCYAEGQTIESYRAVEDISMIESRGSVGGLVYENAGKILNSYANVYIEHRGAFSGAFVFNNTNTGTIENSYSAGTKKNSSNAYGVFTGIENANINNSGTYTNCYYLILDNEATVSSEKAVGMLKCGIDDLFAPPNNWYGFKFATGDAGNGVWKMGTYLPKLVSCEIETFSHRTLLIDNSDSGTTGTDSTMTEYMYYYQYHSTYSYGLAVNPIILDSAVDFNNYILNYSDPINNNADPNAGRTVTGKHFRMVKDLDFTGLTTATKCKNSYIFQTIFSGVLDGNGMSLKNLSLNVGEEEELNIDKFGLFGSIQGGTIKNLTITLSGYSSGSDVTYGGILAGTITNNSTINNVHIIGSGNGNGKVITAKNMAGALAGKIDNCNISDITVENIAISLGYSSVKNGVNFSSNVSHDYKTYSTNVAGNTETYTFVHYDGSNDSRVSYAGGIAGVLQDSEVYDVTVKGDFEIQQSDIAGGLFGFVGKIGSVTTIVVTSKFIVSGGQSIKSFNIAGGLVGELYNAEIDYSSIEHDKALQDRIDDSMLLSDKDRERGYNDLFKLSSIYNIAVGGIVGYMKNAELSNSYSKVNVINPNSFIAGGLVGYVDNEIVTAVNKINYCYSTGSVYSGRIIGGSIGLQLGTTLNMDRVVALTDWNNAGKDDNEINYRNKITERLYSNQVGYYIGNGNYNNFYIKMPEIGNLAPIVTAVADDEHYNRDFAYTNSNIKYLVGSSIGKVVYDVTESNEVDGEIVTTITYPDFIDVTTTNITNIVDQDHNITGVVFSNTLGRYTSSTNSYLDGNKVDSYEKDPFTINLSGIGNRSIGSYRYAYRPVEESTDPSSGVTTNKDSLQYSATKSGYYDIMSFPQIFTAQEYAEQLMGAYSELVASGTSKTNKFTRSVFDEKYDRKSRFAGSQVTDGINTEFVLIDGSSNWIMDEYLPAFKSSVDTTKEISTQDQFINAINTKSDATHILTGDITIEIEDKRDVWIRDSIKFSLIGNQVAVSNVQVLSGEGISARRNPRIEFNIINSSTVHSIFNIIDNVTWKNVDIIINYSNGDCNVTTDNFGLFVNTLNRSLFDNCNITINMGNKTITNNVDADNVGLVFGVVQTTQIADVNVRVVNNVKIGEDVTVYDGNISIQDGKNFGIVAGSFASSSLNNVTVDSDMSDIKLVVANGEYNVGMVGSTTGSSLYNVTNNIDKLSITSSSSTVNAGGLVGNQDNSDIISIANSVNNMKIVLSGNTSTDDKTYVSIGGFVGKAFNVNITQSTVNSEGSITVSYITAQSYIGGVVGRVVDSDNNSKTTSSLSLTNVSNFADIGVSSSANSSNGIYVGGIVGYVENFSGNTIYTNSEITANVQCKLYVGGVVGYAKKSFTVTNVLVAGMINALSNSMLYCGGILGHRDQFITMQGFSVLATITDGDGVGRHSTSNTNYMAGVTYDSKRVDTLTNGFVYTEIPSGKNTYAVSKYTTDMTIENVYFAQEFATNNYESNDSFFNTFALADLYFSTDNPETTEIVDPIEANTSLFAYDDDNNYKMDTIACGNVKVFVPKLFTDSLTELNFIDNRFDLEMFSVNKDANGDATNTINDNKYYVIDGSADAPRGIASVGEKTIISGRTQIDENGVIGFSTLTASTYHGAAVTSYIIGTNNGVISNLRIDLSGDLAFCNTNSSNGLIVGVSVYGNSGMLIDSDGNATSDGNITSAFTVGNAGNIYKCISSYVAVNANCKTIYAFSSNNTGKIIDVYSATIGYSGTTSYILYLVKNANYVYCKNYVIYVPQEVSKFNTVKTAGCSNEVNSDARSKVWKLDNNKYILTNIPLQEHVFSVKLFVNGTLLESISELNSQMSDSDNIDSDYVFTYSLEINSGSEMPTYDGATVKLIYNDTQLIELFKGLEKDYYYRSELKNSIILLIGDSFELKLPSDFTFMVISENSAIIGIPLGDDVKKVTMEITDNNGFDVFIQVNSGLIANINFNFQDQNFNECTPITQNIGVIYNVALSNLTIFVTNNNAKEELNSVQLYMSNSLYVFCGDKNGPYCGTLIRCMVDQYKIQFDYNGKVHTLLFSNSANNYGQLTEVEGVPGRYQVVCFSRYN